jgi:hypothetical protein
VAYSPSAIVEQIAGFLAIVAPLSAGQIKCLAPFNIAYLGAILSKNWIALSHSQISDGTSCRSISDTLSVCLLGGESAMH